MKDIKVIKPRIMMGRLANGSQSDYGRVVHLTESPAYGHGKALCGKSPGRRSAGWSPDDHGAANCPRCLAKATAKAMRSIGDKRKVRTKEWFQEKISQSQPEGNEE